MEALLRLKPSDKPKAVLAGLKSARAAVPKGSLRDGMKVLRALLVASREAKMRTAIARTLRKMIASANPVVGGLVWRAALCEYLDVFLVRCLDRADGGDRTRRAEMEDAAEKLEVLKLVRLLVHREPASLTSPLMAAVIAQAEAEGNHVLRGAAIEVLRQLAISDLATLVRGGDGLFSAAVGANGSGGSAGGGLDVLGALTMGAPTGDGLAALLHALVAESETGAPASPHIVTCVALTFCHLLDAPATRGHVRRMGLQQLLAPLTDLEMAPLLEEADTFERDRRRGGLRACAAALVAMGRTWPGLFALASDSHGLPALLRCLLVPPVERGHLILDVVCELLLLPHLTRDYAQRHRGPRHASTSHSSNGGEGRSREASVVEDRVLDLTLRRAASASSASTTMAFASASLSGHSNSVHSPSATFAFHTGAGAAAVAAAASDREETGGVARPPSICWTRHRWWRCTSWQSVASSKCSTRRPRPPSPRSRRASAISSTSSWYGPHPTAPCHLRRASASISSPT